MTTNTPPTPLDIALKDEEAKFKLCYEWLEQDMPTRFFEEIDHENMMLITHSLMGFDLQNYFSTINLKNAAIVIALDSADADLRILQNYTNYGIKNYLTFVSKYPPPFKSIDQNLRIGLIYFTEAIEELKTDYPKEPFLQLRTQVKERHPGLSDHGFEQLLKGFNTRFLRALNVDRLTLALAMYFRAQTRDSCQYELRYDREWEKSGKPSLEIVFAWKNTPKYGFLYQLALIIHRFGLVMKGASATYVDPYSKDSVLVMSLSLHGSHGEAAWDACNIPNFIRELVTSKYFAVFDLIDKKLVSSKIISGLMGNLLRAAIPFIHQTLVHVDKNLYTLDSVEEGLCYHPELTKRLCNLFHLKFHPEENDYEQFLVAVSALTDDVNRLDTGNEESDNRRKNILIQAINLARFTLKTNLYQQNYTALSFRLDPIYLNDVPFDREEKFPKLPFALFYIKGLNFFGYHIRFRDLARGGLRTVYPNTTEVVEREQKQVFTECYNLAFSQHMKNKDIPEAGAKAIIFLKPAENLALDSEIFKREFKLSGMEAVELDKKTEIYLTEQKKEALYQTQRSFVKSLLALVNCDAEGKLRVNGILDYWKKPEYLYIGPDENMHDSMIQWIADESKKIDYKPGSAFISGKPHAGINHKQYGVTSRGVNVYVEELLKYNGIDPRTQPFTIKMSGGPDGDVAGNEIVLLAKYYPKTAKLIALIDVSGTIYDPLGLDLSLLSLFFHEGKPIHHYPPNLLSEGGFLLDKETKRHDTSLSLQTLLWKKEGGQMMQYWLSSSDMNHLLKTHILEVKADIFIPAGGRPRTLNEGNIDEFLDETGEPSSNMIVEGANLYNSPEARTLLEEMGVQIIKDSSANKTGVICSSFEVLAGLTLGDELFIEHKQILTEQILERVVHFAQKEANLLIKTYDETARPMTEISIKISERINLFKAHIIKHLDTIELSSDPADPLIKCYLNYCLPFLKENFQKELLSEVPAIHQKACIASHISANLVYKKGINWFPSVVDILPLALEEIES